MADFTLAPWVYNPDTGKWQGRDYVAPVSGGTSAFAWSAPEGLADGNDIVITSDTHTFVTPDAYSYLGFGQGWLSSASDGTQLPSTVPVSTAIGSSDLTHQVEEDNRKVVTSGGIKFLRSLLKSASNGDKFNAGFINWDSGSRIPAGEFGYQFATTKMTVGTGEQRNFQWKHMRHAEDPNLPESPANANSIYLKHFTSGCALDAYEGLTSIEYYYNPTGAINKDGIMSSEGWLNLQNTPDIGDGDNLIHAHLDGGAYGVIQPSRSSGTIPATSCIKSSYTNGVRYLNRQDYVGNITDASEIELLVTDLFFQRNGSIFMIAEHVDLTPTGKFLPLVPTQINNSASWGFKLWKGQISSYSNAGIFLLDSNLSVIAGVAL